MAIQWPAKRRLVGTKVPRIDGPDKSTGKAKYSYDINLPGMLHAVIVRCPHARAKIKSVDTKDAEKAKGFKALLSIKKAGDECFYAGDEVLALCAVTEEQARDAARLVKVDYDVLKAYVRPEEIMKLGKDPETVPPVGPKKERTNRRAPIAFATTKVEDGIKEAEVSVGGTYGVPIISHQCLEAHGMVAIWDKEGGLTVYSSTQAVFGTTGGLSNYFSAKGIDLPVNKVRCITQYMGGGFGSKFGNEVEGPVCAHLAYIAKAPVKLFLDRHSEVSTAGNRPPAYGTVNVHGKKDGTITAFESDTYGTPGTLGGGTVGPMPYVYVLQNRVKHTPVRQNSGNQRAMRAPGHPQSCFFTDCALDDFAAKIDMDPMQVRLKNLPQDDAKAKQDDPQTWNALKGSLYKEQIGIIAKMCNWKEKWHKPGKGPKKGPWQHGIGMALHTWGGSASAQTNDVDVTIAGDGSVTVRTSTQDLGTAQRTANAIVTAEVLGLAVADVKVEIGDSKLGRSHGSGGSTTIPTQAPATLIAATKARDALFEKVAGKLGAKAEDLEIVPGKVRDKKASKDYDWKKVCAALGKEQVSARGNWDRDTSIQKENRGLSNVQVGGMQVAEVWVDVETGIVRCTNIWAVQDCGLLINKLACESQVAGGVIMGLNYGLFEELIIDRTTGRVVNADMEFYKLGGINDMPRVHVHMMDMPERGVIGIGEPPTISTHAAIGNALFNALGVRVPQTPFSPDRVLAALAAKGGN